MEYVAEVVKEHSLDKVITTVGCKTRHRSIYAGVKELVKGNTAAHCDALFGLNFKLNYFTTITKQDIQLIFIMLVGTDVCVLVVFMWEETGVPGGNPPA